MTQIVPLADVLRSVVADSLDQWKGGAISIGNFDGVHRGHAALLRQLRKVADDCGGPAIAVALDPHPAAILRPETAPQRLTWIERRAELMDAHQVDALVVCKTTTDFLQLTAERFFDLLVRQTLDAKAMVEGPNFYFGQGRGGSIETLGDLCRRSDIQLQIAEATEHQGEMVSSTRIRRFLMDGNLSAALELLGHSYRIRGQVVAGDRRGRMIGFPTANLSVVDVVVPGNGVYGGFATIDGHSSVAAIHIGPNPTFDEEGTKKIEVHLLDYDGDLYGRELLVDFVTRVRDIARFGSVQELADQLTCDVQTIRRVMVRAGESTTN